LQNFRILKRHKYGTVFSVPVPDSIVGYRDIIKEPMDLGTIETRLFNDEYDLDTYERDVMLVWRNATTFNPVAHPVHEMAVALRTLFLQRFEKVKQKAKALQKVVMQKQKPKKKQESLDMEVRRLAQKMEMMRKRLQQMSSGSSPKRYASKPVSYHERQILRQQIIQLPPEHLSGVAEIVRDAMPDESDSTEVEIDLEALQSSTLRKLQKYVGECMLKMETAPLEEHIESSSEEEDESDDSD